MKSLRSSLFSSLIILSLSVFAQKATLVMPAGHAQKVSQIAVSADYRFLASIDSTNTIIIWEIDGRRELLHLQEQGSSVVNIAFHPTENILVSSNSNGDIVYLGRD